MDVILIFSVKVVRRACPLMGLEDNGGFCKGESLGTVVGVVSNLASESKESSIQA